MNDIKNMDGLEYLKTIDDNSIDLVLTDPPYIISRESGMNTLYNKIKNNNTDRKTEEDWLKYKNQKNINCDTDKEKYLKYGNIYGKKYSVQTDYGNWDKDFTIEILEMFIREFYKKLKSGGTIIIFFDLWKISLLKDLLEKYNFKQIRFIEWVKKNPQPLNSNTNYLTNCRERALTAVKGTKPTFHSKYDNGIYHYPIQGGKRKFHPTQKNLELIKDLIKKHSNEKDIILDTFLGSGTTVFACKETNRVYKGCELSPEYYTKIMDFLNNL